MPPACSTVAYSDAWVATFGASRTVPVIFLTGSGLLQTKNVGTGFSYATPFISEPLVTALVAGIGAFQSRMALRGRPPPVCHILRNVTVVAFRRFLFTPNALRPRDACIWIAPSMAPKVAPQFAAKAKATGRTHSAFPSSTRTPQGCSHRPPLHRPPVAHRVGVQVFWGSRIFLAMQKRRGVHMVAYQTEPLDADSSATSACKYCTFPFDEVRCVHTHGARRVYVVCVCV